MTRKHRNIKTMRTAIVILLVVQFALGNVSVAQAVTTVIFRTRVQQAFGPMPVAFSGQTDFGPLNVGQFRKIRVCANSRGSVSRVRVRLLIIQDSDTVAELETIVIAVGSNQTKVIEVPGMMLRVVADSAPPPPGSSARNNSLDMVIYGSD